MPTRARLKLAARLFQSLVDQTEDLDCIELILYIDEDDTESHSLHHPQLKITKIIGPRTTMGACNSACLKLAAGDIIILINDDMVAHTRGWDRLVLNMNESVPDKIYLAYANDLYMRHKLSIIPIMSRKTCELLIAPYPEQYLGGFIDYHLFDLFKRLKHKGLNRIYFLEDVIFEHLHHRIGKSEYDETYQQRGRMDLGDEIFIALRPIRQNGAERLAASIGNKSLPPTNQTPNEIVHIENCFCALHTFTNTFLMDKGLPLVWRIYLFAIFIKRHIARIFHNYFTTS